MTASRTAQRAAIYCRISRDRVGAGLGVERQEADCRALADTSGARVVAVHTDNDLSAYSGKPRPGYLALLDQVRAGAVDMVIVWHTDRLHRSPTELEEWITAAQIHSVPVHAVTSSPLDLATPSGRMVARQLGAVARYEVEHAIERQKAAKAQAVAAGRFLGGRRPYGFEPDGTARLRVVAREAAVLTDAADRLMAGESLRSVVRDMNQRGLVTSWGHPWSARSLRRVFLSPRIAGLSQRKGQEVGEAGWPAIIEPAQWRTLRRLLTAEGRSANASTDERWLGSGLYLCGVCADGTTMLSATSRSKGAGGRLIPTYRCRDSSHVTRVAQPLDDMITALVLGRLSNPDARLLLAPSNPVVDLGALHVRREDVTARETELAGLFADGAITGAQLAEGTRRLRAEGERLDGEISAATAASPLAGFADAEDVHAAWSAASVSRRKAIIRHLMTITLEKAPRGRPAGWQAGQPYFDPRFVTVTWHSAATPGSR